MPSNILPHTTLGKIDENVHGFPRDIRTDKYKDKITVYTDAVLARKAHAHRLKWQDHNLLLPSLGHREGIGVFCVLTKSRREF